MKLTKLFRRRNFQMLSMLFHYFAIVSSWNLNNVDFSSPKNVFYLICLVLEKKMFSVINAFSQFCYNLPLEKVVTLHLNKLERPLPKDAFCGIWLKLTSLFWRRWKLGKVCNRTGRQNKVRVEKPTVKISVHDQMS